MCLHYIIHRQIEEHVDTKTNIWPIIMSAKPDKYSHREEDDKLTQIIKAGWKTKTMRQINRQEGTVTVSKSEPCFCVIIFECLPLVESITLAEALAQLVTLLEWKISSALRWWGLLAVKFLPLSVGIYRSCSLER